MKLVATQLMLWGLPPSDIDAPVWINVLIVHRGMRVYICVSADTAISSRI